MGKKRTTWVLDTETKGTGAEMVPLERLQERKRLKSERERIRVIGPESEPRETSQTEPESQRGQRRFRIVDVRSRQVLAENTDLPRALEALSGVGSIVDVNVYAREAGESRWRALSMSERRTLWGFREPTAAAR